MFKQLSRSLSVFLMMRCFIHNLNSRSFFSKRSCQCLLDLLETKTSLPEYFYLIIEYFQNCTFNSELTFTSIDDPNVIFIEIIENMNSLSWAHMTKQIRTRSSDWQLALLQQPSEIRMVGASYSYKPSLGCNYHG